MVQTEQLTLLQKTMDIPPEPGPEEEVYVFPLSFAQERLWFLDQFEPNSPFYNIPTAVRLTGRLDVVALQQALNEIVRRHESLRTTFATLDREPVQVISPALTLDLPLLDLRDLPQPEREARALHLATEEAKSPFNLSRGPLLRATLLRLEKQEYLMLLTMHHIVSDGWSMGVLVNELTTLYDAFSSGQPSPLPELPIQYADFAHWQREWLQGQVLESQLDYWKQHLDSSVGILELPTDYPRPAVQTSRGATQSLELSGRLLKALKALSQDQRVTLFMTLLAAFQTLLHRYTGQHAISVGSPIANRNRAEIEGLIGFFVNTLILHTDLSGDPTFRELLARVRQVTLEAYSHQDLPFEMLVDTLQPERDMSHTPLFQVMFILQNVPVKAQELSTLNLRQVDVHSGTSTFDLTLSMSEGANGLAASMEYSTDLFGAATIARMLQHFQTLLEGIVANPDRHISQLPLLTQTERQQLLVEWNATTTGYPQDPCVHQLFETQSEQTPGAVAVVVPSTDLKRRDRLSYRELNRRANQLAHYLQKRGVGPETVVGVCLDRSLEMIVAVLGILKAGGAYLPLDPMYPQERLAFMLKDSQVSILLTQGQLAAGLPIPGRQVVCLDTGWETIARESDENPTSSTTAGNLVYMIYTSGSTGQSKGVMIQHRSLVNAYLAWKDAYQLQPSNAHLQMANFSFDVFSADLVRALCSGAKLVLCPRELLLSPRPLYELMRRENIDCAEFVPAVLRGLMQYLDESGQHLHFIRLLACGSDSWYAREYRHFLRFCGPQTRLINSFGLTEATIDSSYFESATLDLSADQLVPIGRPFANMRLHILDTHLQPVPPGVPAELYVGGLGVARGYHNRPELTAEKFVPDPFGDEPGACLYKTGDRARYLPDGNIEFLGRMDNQVKIRGFRIEPGEIEAALGKHPAVGQAVVLAVEAAPGDRRLAAYVVPARQPAPTSGELRRFLQQALPDYMVPSAFVLLDTLPLTPNGKIDRQVLPAPEWSRQVLEGEYVAPRTPVEEVLAGIWARVLSVEQVGVHDNFFELGGHSLLATQLVSRVRKAFEIDLPLRTIFESPTVATLAEHVEIATRTEAGVQAPPIRPVPWDKDIPLSFAQQRLWFLDQLEPGSPFYNIPEAVRLTGPLDVTVLKKSLNEIVQRHQALRTTFRAVDGKPHQVIAPELTIPLPIVDLRHLPKSGRQSALQSGRQEQALRLAQQEAQQPFDLARGPLLRARLLRLDDQDHIVLLTMHHIIGDNWSTNILIHEIATLYDAFSHGRPSPLPDLPVQYADFAHWQREWLQGDVLETQLDYWEQQLAGLPPLLELPTDRPRPPVQTYRGDYQSFHLSSSLSGAIKALCHQEGVTLFMALLAAFQTLLHRYAGQENISVGSPIANRNRLEIEGLIGFFVNTLILRTDLSGKPGFREVLKRVREVTLGAYAHQDLPFEMIVDTLQPERNLSHSPLFQVMFALQSAQMQSRALPGSELTLGPVEAHSGTAKFDLTLFMIEEEDHLSGALEYNTDLFDAATIERMLKHFQTLLQNIVADPDRPVSTQPLLTQSEGQQLLIDWNATAALYPRDRCVHELFEAQVERTPDAVAVAFEKKQLTYAQLNRQANQLAHYLQKLGAGPETLVGICAERVPEMVVGLLAILKAGSAYLPLDPTYPPERLAFMLEDSQSPILLTRERWVTTLPTQDRRVICLDTDWDLIAPESQANPISRARPENLAYVIYTSGSTGKPKGAMILHRGLVNYMAWCQQAYPVKAGQGAPVHSSISFDLTITGLFAPLLAGRKVQLVPEDLGIDLLSTALRNETDYSLVKITPAHLELLSQQLAPQQAAGRTRAFIIGGENLLAESIAFWQDYAPHTLLVNEYGPTETVVGCCVYQVPPDERRAGSVPIGRPIINTQLYILDTHMQPAPIGVPGELYIGGAGVARGYLNRPALTAGCFVPDPFSNEPAARLYKTGDLARYLPDGNIEFLGRIDHQVKVRGFRIELGEIEAVLSQHPAVGEAVVLAREDAPTDPLSPGKRGKRLVAYVVPEGDEGDHTPGVGELRRFLSEKLPDYMLPAAFVTLQALPLTPNGKVDRRALPAPEQARPDLEAAYVAPHTPAEKTLAAIWAQLLDIDQVGIHDSFFELGGDSILSIQVIARANQAGLRLTPRQIFQHPTVAGLAAVAGRGPAIQAEQGIIQGPVPLTPIQHWFFDQDLPEPHHWNQAILLETQEALEAPLLEKATGHLVAHHDALRLRFDRRESGWQQINAGEDTEPPLVWIDLSALAEADREPAVETHAAALQASLDLSVGPLLRVAYFDLGAGRPGRLMMAIHHLAVDGVSWPILLQDLQTAYEQLRQGETVRLPPKTTSFQRWAQRLTEYAQSEEIRNELEYWLSAQPAQETRLPVDDPGGDNTEASARSVTVSLSTRETRALLQEVPPVYRTEINDVLLTALAQALAQWTRERTLLVNLEGHGREDIFEDIDLSRTVGWFTALYPVRLDLEEKDEKDEPGKALMTIKEQLRRIPRRGIGYGLLRYLCQDEKIVRQLKTLPQPELSFNYLGQIDQALSETTPFAPATQSRGPDRSPRGKRSHLLEIDGGIAGGRLQLEWTYSQNLYHRATIESLAQNFIEALRALIAHCQSPTAGGYTPSDFAEFDWSQQDLEDIVGEITRSVESIQ